MVTAVFVGRIGVLASLWMMNPDNMNQRMWCDPSDGGIKRGDRADTGDEQGLPLGEYANADDFEGASDILDNYQSVGSDLADLTVLEADDPALGLTNIGNKPGEDWAADTGPTRSNEEFDETTGGF